MNTAWKTLAAALCLTVVPAATASAQTGSSQFIPAVEPGPDNFMSSTVAEGFFTGLARGIRAMGQYNLNTAEARKLNEDAREHHLKNKIATATTYFDLRSINRQGRRQLEPAPISQSQLDEVMRSRAPRRLSHAQLNRYTGAIRWPEALEYSWFDAQRRQMDALFRSWAKGRGGSGSRVHGRVVLLAGEMIDQLRANSREVSTQELAAARKFIDGLRYEAQLSPRDAEVADTSDAKTDRAPARTMKATQNQFASDGRR